MSKSQIKSKVIPDIKLKEGNKVSIIHAEYVVIHNYLESKKQKPKKNKKTKNDDYQTLKIPY